MGTDHRRIVNGTIAAINLVASVITLVPVVGVVAVVVLSVLEQPAVAVADALLTAAAGLVLIGRRAAIAGSRGRSNARTTPLLRAALVAVAEASRDIALRIQPEGRPRQTQWGAGRRI